MSFKIVTLTYSSSDLSRIILGTSSTSDIPPEDFNGPNNLGKLLMEIQVEKPSNQIMFRSLTLWPSLTTINPSNARALLSGGHNISLQMRATQGSFLQKQLLFFPKEISFSPSHFSKVLIELVGNPDIPRDALDALLIEFLKDVSSPENPLFLFLEYIDELEKHKSEEKLQRLSQNPIALSIVLFILGKSPKACGPLKDIKEKDANSLRYFLVSAEWLSLSQRIGISLGAVKLAHFSLKHEATFALFLLKSSDCLALLNNSQNSYDDLLKAFCGEGSQIGSQVPNRVVLKPKIIKGINSQAVSKEFLVRLVQKKPSVFSHNDKKEFVQFFNKSRPFPQRVLYDFKSEGGIIRESNLKEYLLELSLFDLNDTLGFIENCLDIRSSAISEIIVQVLVIAIENYMKRDEKSKSPEEIADLLTKYGRLFTESKATKEKEVKGFVQQALRALVSWNISTKEQITKVQEAVSQFFGKKENLYSAADVNEEFVGSTLWIGSIEEISPTGALAVLSKFTKNFEIDFVEPYQVFSSHLFGKAKKQRLEDVLTVWKEVFENSDFSEIEILLGTMPLLISQVTENVFENSSAKQTIASKSHPKLESLLYESLFEKAAIGKPLTAQSFVEFLDLGLNGHQNAACQDAFLKVLSECFEIEKTNQEKGLKVTKKKWTKAKRNEVCADIEIGMKKSALEARGILEEFFNVDFSDKMTIEDIFMNKSPENWLKSAILIYKWQKRLSFSKSDASKLIEIKKIEEVFSRALKNWFRDLTSESLELVEKSSKVFERKADSFSFLVSSGSEGRERKGISKKQRRMAEKMGSDGFLSERMAEPIQKESNREKVMKFLKLKDFLGENKVQKAKVQLEKFQRKLVTLKQISQWFSGEVKETISRDLELLNSGLKESLIKNLKLSGNLQSVWEQIEAKEHLLSSDIFIFYFQETIKKEEFISSIDKLTIAIEKAMESVKWLIMTNRRVFLVSDYMSCFGMNLVPVIRSAAEETDLWIKEFGISNQYEQNDIMEFILWLSRSREIGLISQICDSISLVGTRLYNRSHSILQYFELAKNEKFLENLEGLQEVWELFSKMHEIQKEGLLLLFKLEPEIKLLRNTDEKILNDVSEFLRDPSQVAVFGNRCQVSDITMLQALKDKDLELQKTKTKDDRAFLLELIHSFEAFIKENHAFCDHVAKFSSKEEVEFLKMVFENVGDQSKLISSTVKTILLAENNPRLILKVWRDEGDISLRISILAHNNRGDKLVYTMNDLNEYFEVLNLQLENSGKTSSSGKNSETNDLFFSVYSDVKRVEQTIKRLYDEGFDIVSCVQQVKSTQLVTALGKNAVRALREQMEETLQEWLKKHKLLCRQFGFLNNFVRGELSLILDRLKHQNEESVKVDQLLKIIGKDIKLATVSELVEAKEILGKKSYLSQVELFAERIASTVANSEKRHEEFTQMVVHGPVHHELDSPIVFWSFESHMTIIQTVLSAFIRFSRFSHHLEACHPSHLLIVEPQTPDVFVKAFFTRMAALKSGEFFIILPLSSATQPNSSQIHEVFCGITHNLDSISAGIKHIVIIHHKGLSSNDFIEPGLVLTEVLSQKNTLGLPEIKKRIEKATNPTKIYTSEGSGDGKSFVLKRTHPSRKYLEITLGNHNDFSKWIERIQELIFGNNPSYSGLFVLNIVIGVPAILDRPEEVQSFYGLASLFCFLVVTMGFYRSSQSFLELDREKVLIQFEVSNTLAGLAQRNLELLNFFEEVKVGGFELEKMVWNEIELDDDFLFVSKTQGQGEKKYSKIKNLVYVFELINKRTISSTRMKFPCPGANTLSDNACSRLLRTYFLDLLLEKSGQFGRINFRNVMWTLSMMFLEFLAYNFALLKTQEETKNMTVLSSVMMGSESKLLLNNAELLKEVVKFCLAYTSSSAAKFIAQQSQALKNSRDSHRYPIQAKESTKESKPEGQDELYYEFMKNLYSDENIVRFEQLQLCLIYFSPEKFHLLFKDRSAVSEGLAHSLIIQEYTKQSEGQNFKTSVDFSFDNFFSSSFLKKESRILKSPEEELFIALEDYKNACNENKSPPKNAMDVLEARLLSPLEESPDKLWELLGKIMGMTQMELRHTRDNSGFQLTRDGLLKIVIIAKKLMARYPIILIGETGTGKTFLIKFMARFILPRVFSNPEMDKYTCLHYKKVEYLYKLIHAGLSEKDIVKCIQEFNQTAESSEQSVLFLVFFDEFNTASSIDILSAAITQNSLFGKKLAKNLIFLGACNPFRVREVSALQKKDEESSALVHPKGGSHLTYSVNPLTEAELAFLMDFGKMTVFQEKMYTRSIIGSALNSRGASPGEIEEAVQLVTLSQQFTRDYEGEASMSIRDIKKFTKAFIWLREVYVNHRFSLFSSSASSEDFERLPLLVSLWLVYYLRIVTNTRRKQYIMLLNDSGAPDLMEIVKREQSFVIDNMVFEDGIAKNTPLLENVFALFICFNCRLPILICGKPGCSKTLAIDILNENLKGFLSHSPFIKLFPKVIFTYYQGSTNSRSEGIISAFENAEKIAKSHSKNETLEESQLASSRFTVVLVFDELGLAELSPYNPLKVLHFYLDDDNESYSGFVGLSNWGLDAAKNNRAVFVARPDLSVEDLKTTAQNISQKFNKPLKTFSLGGNPFDSNFFLWSHLAECYQEYIMASHLKHKKVFHGPRDFYSLIKSIAVELPNFSSVSMDLEKLGEMIQLKIHRNFGGLLGSSEAFVALLKRRISFLPKQSPSLQEVLADYVHSPCFRYLMIIGKGGEYHALIHIMSRLIQKENQEIRGVLSDKSRLQIFSGLPPSFSAEEVETRVTQDLNLIQQSLKKGDLICLNNYPEIYSSLYELFNMKRRKIQGKMFCEIAHSSKTNRYVEVAESAKIIVFVDEKNIEKEQAPFLNRFEKFILSFDHALSPEELSLSLELSESVKALSSWKNTQELKAQDFRDGNAGGLEEEDKGFNRCDWTAAPEFVKSLLIRMKSKENGEVSFEKAFYRMVQGLSYETVLLARLSFENNILCAPIFELYRKSLLRSNKKYGSLFKVFMLLRKRENAKLALFSEDWRDSKVVAMAENFPGFLLCDNLHFPEDFHSEKYRALIFKVSSPSEVSVLSQIDRIIGNTSKCSVLALVSIKSKEVDPSLLRPVFPSANWKCVWLEKEEQSVPLLFQISSEMEEANALELLKKQKHVLVEALMSRMLALGISLEPTRENQNFQTKIGQLEQALEICLTDQTLSGLFEKGIRFESLPSTGNGGDWRVSLALKASSHSSFWQATNSLLPRPSISSLTFRLLRALILNGIPQSIQQTKVSGEAACKFALSQEELHGLIHDHFAYEKLRALKRELNISQEEAPLTQSIDAQTPKEAVSLHYPYFIPFLWVEAEKLFDQFKKDRNDPKRNFQEFMSGNRTKIKGENSLVNLMSVPKGLKGKKEREAVMALFLDDSLKFFEERESELKTHEGKALVKSLIQNNPKILSQLSLFAKQQIKREGAEPHVAVWLGLFYTQEVLGMQAFISRFLRIEPEPSCFVLKEPELLAKFILKVISESLEYEPEKTIKAFRALEDLGGYTGMDLGSLNWRILAIMMGICETKMVERSDENMHEFYSALVKTAKMMKKQENGLLLCQMMEAILQMPLSYPISIRKGVQLVLEEGYKEARKQLKENIDLAEQLEAIVLSFAFRTTEASEVLLKIVSNIFSKNQESLLSLPSAHFPKWIASTRLDSPFSAKVFRLLFVKILICKLKERLPLSVKCQSNKELFESYPKELLQALVAKYQSDSDDFLKSLFGASQLNQQVLWSIVYLHTELLSQIIKKMAMGEQQIDQNYLRKMTNYVFKTKNEKEKSQFEFYEFGQKALVRKAIRNGTSLAKMIKFGEKSGLKFELLSQNIQTQFMWNIHSANDGDYKLINNQLIDSFFGVISFGKNLEASGLHKRPLFSFHILQTFMNNLVVFNEIEEEAKLKEKKEKLIRSSQSLIPLTGTSLYLQRMMEEYSLNLPSVPCLSLTPKHNPQKILRNFCMLTLANSVIAKQRGGLHSVFFHPDGSQKTVSEISNQAIPGTLSEKAKNYIYVLDLDLNWRNYSQRWATTTHLLLECQKCMNLNPMFACNNPELVVLCNPPTCQEPVNGDYVAKNHINNIHNALPERMVSIIKELRGLHLFDVASSKKDTRLGKTRMLTVKIIHLVLWSFLITAIHFSEDYLEAVSAIQFRFETEKKEEKPDKKKVAQSIKQTIKRYMKEIAFDFGLPLEDSYFLVIGIAIELLIGPASRITEREKFEEELEKIIEEFEREKSSKLSEVKRSFMADNVSNEMIQLIEDSERDKSSEVYMSMSQSLETEELSLGSIQMEIIKNSHVAPLANFVFSRKTEIKKLRFLKEMADCYSAIINKYQQVPLETEIQHLKVKDILAWSKSSEKWKSFPEDFNRLQRVWNEANIYDIHLGCRVLPRRLLSEDDPALIVFPTVRERRGNDQIMRRIGMYLPALIQTMTELHNYLISLSIDCYDHFARDLLSPNYNKKLGINQLAPDTAITLGFSLTDFLSPYTTFSLVQSGNSLSISTSCDFKVMDRDLMMLLIRKKQKIVSEETELPVFAFKNSIWQANKFLTFLDGVAQVPITLENTKRLIANCRVSESSCQEFLSSLEQMALEVKFALEKSENKQDLSGAGIDFKREIAEGIRLASLKRTIDIVEVVSMEHLVKGKSEQMVPYRSIKMEKQGKLKEFLKEFSNKFRNRGDWDPIIDISVMISFAISRYLLENRDLDSIFLSQPLLPYIECLSSYASEQNEEREEALNAFLEVKLLEEVPVGSAGSFLEMILELI